MDKLTELYEKGVSRRNFMAGAGALGAASLLAGCSDSGTVPTVTPTASQFTDFDILNYALNLEYLEAEFYLYAATGSGISAADAGSGAGATIATGAVKVPNLTPTQQAIVNEIAYDELTHVQYLRKAITAFGGTPVARPVIDLTFFGPLAVAAGITTAATGAGSFSPFTDFNSFLIGAFIFEDVGVTAYNGGATLITGVTNGVLNAAAGILAVEAYHAAYVRTAITGSTILSGGAPILAGLNAVQIANKVSALRATLGGGNETMLNVPTSPSTPSAIVAADPTNAIAYHRNTDQVHHIVYGSPTVGVSKGGFFPNGTNSYFSVTKS